MTLPMNGIHRLGKFYFYLALTLAACAGSFAQQHPPTLSSPPAGAICPPTDGHGISAARIGESLTLGNGSVLGVSPDEMARQLVGNGVAITKVTYTGASRASGMISGLEPHLGADTWIVLGTGDLQNVVGRCSGQLMSPDKEGIPDSDTLISTANGGSGDPGLEKLLPRLEDGSYPPSFDAASLEIQFIPEYDNIQLNYVFASDEYPEYVNTGFNDAFAFFLNGSNVALLPNSTVPVSIDNVNNGNPVRKGLNGSMNPQFFLDNQARKALPLEMDGLTMGTDPATNKRVPMVVQAKVIPHAVNTLRMVVADIWDMKGDSIVMLKGLSLTSVPDLLDSDKDGVADGIDNCPYVFNPDQTDSNFNGAGDVCDSAPLESARALTFRSFVGLGQVVGTANDRDRQSFAFSILPHKDGLNIDLHYFDWEKGIQIRIDGPATSYTSKDDLTGVGLMFKAPCEVTLYHNGRSRGGYTCSGYVVERGDPDKIQLFRKQAVPDQFKLTVVTDDPTKAYSSGIPDLVWGNVQALRDKK